MSPTEVSEGMIFGAQFLRKKAGKAGGGKRPGGGRLRRKWAISHSQRYLIVFRPGHS